MNRLELVILVAIIAGALWQRRRSVEAFAWTVRRPRRIVDFLRYCWRSRYAWFADPDEQDAESALERTRQSDPAEVRSRNWKRSGSFFVGGLVSLVLMVLLATRAGWWIMVALLAISALTAVWRRLVR